MRRARHLNLQVLNSLPFEERSDWAEETLERRSGLSPLRTALRQPSLLSLRDPSLTAEQRMKIEAQLEKTAERKKRQLLSDLERALKLYGLQKEPSDNFDFTQHPPVKFYAAFDLARRNPEIKSSGAALHAARELTRDSIGSRDRMLAVWSYIWQASDITDLGQPETLAYILNPVLLNGSANTAAITLKSLAVLHRVLANNTLPQQRLTRPNEIEFILQQAAQDYGSDNLVQRLAKQALSDITSRPANDHVQTALPKSAARLSKLIVAAHQTARVKVKHSRRKAGLSLS